MAEPFAEAGFTVLRERGMDIVSRIDVPRTELLSQLREADGLIVRSETRVDHELLEAAPNLRVVGRAGVGVDAIDVRAATQAGIVVVNTPSANIIAATEQTFALLLALVRHVPAANQAVRAGRWERTPFVGNELFGKTLGIVGLGRIGSAVALRAHAFGMTVLASDPYVPGVRAEAFHATLVELEELLHRADVVTLHVPLTQHTDRLIDAARLRAMKPTAVLVNCARGGVVDEEALLEALDGDVLRAAFLSGVLQTTTDRRVSVVNAEAIARETGLELEVRADASRDTAIFTHDVIVRLAILERTGRGASQLWEPRVTNGGHAEFLVDGGAWDLTQECARSHLRTLAADPGKQAL